MDFKKTGYYLKKGFSYIPRITPGVGLVSLARREYKERKGASFPYYNLRKKEDRIAMGKYAIQVAWLGFAIFKAGVTYKGAQSIINNMNNPKDKSIDPMEIKQELKKENKLEKKTTNFEDILKVIG
jgi:hypothetical protein